MPRPNAIVDAVRDLEISHTVRGEKPAAEGQRLAVAFGGGESGFLDMSQPKSSIWLEVLESARETRRPVYVELEPRTGVIRELLLPMTVSVESIEELNEGDGVEVQLVISHARHFLRSKNPEYRRLLRVLEQALKRGAQVFVTETLDTHEIIDVRPAGQAVQQRSGRA